LDTKLNVSSKFNADSINQADNILIMLIKTLADKVRLNKRPTEVEIEAIFGRKQEKGMGKS